MKPVGTLSAPPDCPAVSCAVVAWDTVRATVDVLKTLRQNPGPKPGPPLPPAFLKHADDQTVAGLAAVLRAIDRHGLSSTDVTQWGIVAAPRFLARAMLAQALKRFQLEGAWGVSPHLIPHRSLHSVSGTVSQALKIHGPNFGVGGGPSSTSKALLAAATLVADTSLPGLWLILTGWNWEPGLEDPMKPSTNGHHAAAAVCSAAALALQPLGPDHHEECDYSGGRTLRVRLRLHVAPGSLAGGQANAHGNAEARNGHAISPFSLEALLDALDKPGFGPTSRWQLGCGGWVGLESIGAEKQL